MDKIVDAYFWLLKVLIALFLAIMVVLVFGNVFLRYAFNSGITVSEEVSRWLFVWLTFLGAIVAMREHGHLGVDSLVKRPADHRQEGRAHRQPAPHALRHLAPARRELGADADQLGRHGAGLGAFGRPVLRRRPRLRGLDRHHSARRLWTAPLTGKLSEAELVMVKESEEQEELEALQRELKERDLRRRTAGAISVPLGSHKG